MLPFFVMLLLGLAKEAGKVSDAKNDLANKDACSIPLLCKYVGKTGMEHLIKNEIYQLFLLIESNNAVSIRLDGRNYYFRIGTFNDFRIQWQIVPKDAMSIAFAKDYQLALTNKK